MWLGFRDVAEAKLVEKLQGQLASLLRECEALNELTRIAKHQTELAQGRIARLEEMLAATRIRADTAEAKYVQLKRERE